jgi:hypothetical protein
VPVAFTDIAEFLGHAGLLVPNFNVLVPDAQPYSVLAFQPGGQFTFSPALVGNANRDLSLGKFTAFLANAAATNVDLALTPEYSCPWQAIENALAAGHFPNVGKLWVLGCESITPNELSALSQRLPNIAWICEAPTVAPGKFLDPVCYLFTTETNAGVPKRVIALQFKTVPMGGGKTFERDNMLFGTRRYYLRNRDQDFLRFYTIICSESLEFGIDAARAVELIGHPSIIFHPQMVEDSRHPDMRKYRADLFAHACSAHAEVISLNWARELSYPNGANGLPNSIRGYSALFMKSNRFDKSDNRIKNNHKLGAYYSRWRERQSDVCLLNYDEHVFHFVNQKAYLLGAAVQERRTGPEIRESKTWHATSNSWDNIAHAEDGFLALCQSYETEHLNFCLDQNATPADRERLLTLCAGTLDTVPDWHSVENIQSFISEADERSKRLTFVHDGSVDSRNFRNDHLTRFIGLQTVVLANPANFPPNIEDLRGNFIIAYPVAATQFRFNLLNRQNNQNGATVIFLGVIPRSEAKEFYQRLRTGWGKKDGKMREELVRRIVVAYLGADGTLRMEYPVLGSYTDDSEIPSSISNGE